MRSAHELPAPRVVFVEGALHQVTAEVDAVAGRRVLFVADPHFAVACEVLVVGPGSRLAGVGTDVAEHVPVERRIGAPRSLAEIGFDPAGIDEAAAAVMAAPPPNPRPPGRAVDPGPPSRCSRRRATGRRPGSPLPEDS